MFYNEVMKMVKWIFTSQSFFILFSMVSAVVAILATGLIFVKIREWITIGFEANIFFGIMFFLVEAYFFYMLSYAFYHRSEYKEWPWNVK